MKIVRRTLLVVAALLVIVGGATYWVVGTQSGANWLLRQAEERSPDGLALGTAQGTLLRGIEVATVHWRSDTVDLRATAVAVHFDLLPLLDRQLLVRTLSSNSFDLSIAPGTEETSEDEAFEVRLPVDIELQSGRLRNLSYSDGDNTYDVDEVTLAGDLRGSLLRIRQLAARSAWADLDATGNLELAGDLAFDATAEWRWKQDAAQPFAGRVQAGGSTREITFDHELLEPLPLASRGSVSFAPDALRIDIANEWRQLRWQTPQGMLSSSRGTLHLRGRADDLEIDLDAAAALDDRPEAALTATGGARWEPQPAFDVVYDIRDLDTAYLYADLAGKLASHGRLAGLLRGEDLVLDLRADELAGDVNGYPLSGNVTAHIEPGATDISESYVRLGDNHVRLRGRIAESIAIDATADLGNLGQAVPGLSGSARGHASLRGTLERPQINGELQLTALATGGITVDAADIRLAGAADAHTLTARVTAYETNLVTEAQGTIDAGNWSGRVLQMEIDNPLAGRWIAGAGADVEVTPALSRLSEICLDRTELAGQACFGGAFAADGRAAFDLSVAGLPIAALPVTLPAGVSVTGAANARLTVARTDQQLRADARLDFAGTSFDAVYMDESVALELSEANGQASIVNNRLESSFRMALADGSGVATATLAVPDIRAEQPTLAGDAAVEISDAALFAIFVPGISKPQGRIDGEIGISGTPEAPEIIGSIHVTDGAFGLRQTGVAISDLNLELSQHEPGQVRLEGSARSGDGTIEVAGYTWVGQDLGIRSEVTLTGENFELARLPDWQVAASPDIKVVFDDRTTRVTGDLGIPTAQVRMREAPQSAVQPSTDTIVHREQTEEVERRRRIDINLRTTLGDDVQFTGFGLTAGLGGSVRLRGGTHAPYTGQGKLSLVDGRYKAFGQELVIERGDLVFNGPLEEPLLDILAVRTVQDVRAGIQLSGTPSRLSSDIFSDPVLSDAEALAYLLTGRPLADATSAGEGQALDQAAFALGLSGAGLISAQIRAQLGLETLTIEGVGDDSRLIAGKRLGDRLLVEYGYGLVDKLGTLLLRYQLNERLVLESRTGAVSNFDIVYRRRKQ